MRFNPILSIILGAFLIIVAFVTLAGFLGAPNLNNKLITGIFLILAMLILLMGGFVATHFAKEYENKIYYGYKIRYAIYLGLILASLETIGTAHNLAGYKGIGTTIAYFILFPLITGIGGFIAKMTEKNNRQLFKSKHLTNGLSPTIAVIVGFVVATLCADLLLLIIGINPISTSYGIINFVVDATSILIGGFVTLFLVKRKKDTIWDLCSFNCNNNKTIQIVYSICTGYRNQSKLYIFIRFSSWISFVCNYRKLHWNKGSQTFQKKYK